MQPNQKAAYETGWQWCIKKIKRKTSIKNIKTNKAEATKKREIKINRIVYKQNV